MYIEELHSAVGKTVTLKGWVANKREGKGIVFVILRDGTGYCQCVVTEDTAGAEGLANGQDLSLECSVSLTGTVVTDEKQMGGYELQVTAVEPIGKSENYPIAKKEHGGAQNGMLGGCGMRRQAVTLLHTTLEVKQPKAGRATAVVPGATSRNSTATPQL